MLKVGLTGGIGSGKTTVAHIFQRLGVPIYFSDDRAKHILDNDLILKKEISDYFNIELSKEGLLDKKALASIVFTDKKALEHLNSLVHPKVGEDFENWIAGLPEDTPYIIKEAAILYESGAAEAMDTVIVVSAPIELRIERVMGRDKVSREAVIDRMDNQWSEEKKIDLANHVIYNDQVHSILSQILDLHLNIMEEE